MKIAHLISEDTGGAKTHIMTLLKELNRCEEHDGEAFSALAVSLSEGSFYEAVKAAGIRTTLLAQSGRMDLSVAGKLAGLIRREGIDVLHCHGGRANLVGALVRARKLCPVVSTIHSDYRHDYDHHPVKKLLFTRINRFALGHLDGYLPVTEAFKTLMAEEGFDKDRMHVVYNGVSPELPVYRMPSREDFLKELGLAYSPGSPVVGTVTRLHPVKGTEVFLEAARLVCKARPECRFVVAGTGEERLYRQYKAYIESNGLEEKIALAGFQKEIHSFLAQLDINVLASYSESFSYSLLEGGLHALPTIASAVGGLPEMIDDGRSGLLFPAGDSKALAACILRLIDGRQEAAQMGEAFKSDVINRFSDAAMARRHLAIYAQILEDRNRE